MKVPSSAASASISESSTRASQPETSLAGAFSAQLLEAIRERFHAPTGLSAFLDSAAGSLKLKAASETLAESSRWPDNRFGPDSVPSSEILRRGADDLGLQEGIRVSTCHYTAPDEIEHFLEVTASIASAARR